MQDGARYEGEWVNGAMYGNGTMKFATGDTYVGEFKDDKLHGQGTWKQPQGYK